MQEIFEILKKDNHWYGNPQKRVGFRRDFYLKKIEATMGNKLIKVLVGQRRAGKSFLLRQIIEKLLKGGTKGKNIFYLNKELVDYDEIRNYKDLNKLIKIYLEKIKPKGKVYYFLDEVQEIDGWQKIVNSLAQDHRQSNEVFISGSNSKMLSGELTTYLTGRYISFEIFPFSYSEYLKYFKLENSKKNLINFIQNTGLPEILSVEDEEFKRNYLQSLKDAILLKDIAGRYQIRQVKMLEKIMDYISDNIGNIFSVDKVSNFLRTKKYKVSNNTISSYLKYLSETFLIYEVSRYDLKGKDILDSGKKYYLNDLAFRNFIFSKFDAGLGKHLENIVFLNLRRNGWRVNVGKFDNLEIDFVAEKAGEVKYIQVAYSLADKKVAEREFGNLEKIKDSYEKVVLSLDDISFGDKNGIKHWEIWKWLVEER
jgi:predicted AAA+ superfamily ATPase